MRRIPRIRQSVVLRQCLQAPASTSTHTALTRAAAATSCPGRPRDFSTTRSRTFDRSRGWAAKAGPRDEPEVESSRRKAYHPHSPPPPRVKTDLILPHRQPSVAPRVGDLDPEAAGYKPALRADTLEVVGDLKGWFAEDKNNWGASKRFVAFAPQFDKDAPPAVLELSAARAVLEAVAVAAHENVRGKERPRVRPRAAAGAAHDLTRRGKGRSVQYTALAATWRHGGREGLNRALQMEWTVADDGSVQVGKKGYRAVAKGLLEGAQDQAVVMEEAIPAQEAQEILKNWSHSWKKISLEDDRLKFAVAKRVYQLTGRAIPDAKLLHVERASQLLALLVKPPPPRTVFEAVQKDGELTKLPNVQIHPRRVTPVDKAMAVGSWKVIEKELEKRNLPVLGNGNVDKFAESEWYRGPKLDEKSKKKRRRH